MSTHVCGLKDNAEHEKHVTVWEFCMQQKVSLPKETAEYFGWESHEAEGIDPKQMNDGEIEEMLEVSERDLISHGCLKEWGDDSRTGFELDVSKIPKDVTRIGFFNSY